MPHSGIVDITVDRINNAIARARNANRPKEGSHHRPVAKHNHDATPHPAGVGKPQLQRRPPHRVITLEDLEVANRDGRGFPITRNYAGEAGQHAISQADEVAVNFADDRPKAQTQRKMHLAGERGSDGSQCTGSRLP